MKKNVTVFGLITGLIITAMMIYSTAECYSNADFKSNMLLGYGTMILAFSFVFVGIKNFRDKRNNGTITFGKAFRTGLYITLIASSIYVVVWLIEYYIFIPNFMEKYTAHVLKEAQANGASGAELDKQVAELEKYKVMYQNPLFVVLLTYLEVLPIGLIISLLSAWILKKKPADGLGN